MSAVDAIDWAKEERKKYERSWADPTYRKKAHGLELFKQHREIFPDFFSALDIGCGHGRLFAHLNEIGKDAWAVDIAANCLDKEIARKWKHKFKRTPLWEMRFDQRFDLGVCADVMEHIPPEHVKATLERIADCCKVTVFKIANFGSNMNGMNLHLTQEDAAWWRAQMRWIGGRIKQHDLPSPKEHYFFVWTP